MCIQFFTYITFLKHSKWQTFFFFLNQNILHLEDQILTVKAEKTLHNNIIELLSTLL